MSNAAKKIGSKTILFFFSLGTFLIAFAFQLLFGNSHLNISKLNSKAGDVLQDSNRDMLISVARADTPGSTGCGEGGDGDGGSGDGSGGDGCDGGGG